jgi:aryl carrier-like protein
VSWPNSRDELRSTIALAIGEPDNAFSDDDLLMDVGLDSVRAMMLILEWRKAGLEVALPSFGVEPTVNGWWRVIEAAKADR